MSELVERTKAQFSGKTINLADVGARVTAVLDGALLHSNPTGADFDTMRVSDRINMVKRQRDYFLANYSKDFFAFGVSAHNPVTRTFLGEQPNFTWWPPKPWPARHDPLNYLELTGITRAQHNPTVTVTPQTGSTWPVDFSMLKQYTGAYCTTSGTFPSSAVVGRWYMFGLLGRTVDDFPMPALADYYAEDRVTKWLVDQFGDALQVPMPPVYKHLDTVGDQDGRNKQNRLRWYQWVRHNADVLMGYTPDVEAPDGYLPINLPKKGSEYYASQIASLGTMAFLAWGVTSAAISAMPDNWTWIKNQWAKANESARRPLDTAKAFITDPVGSVQAAISKRIEHEVLKVTGPLGRVYEIYVDPAGFVRDKVNEEILYPLKNPGEWIVDTARKELRNRVTGELRDLITGAIIGSMAVEHPVATLPGTVDVVAVPDNVPEYTSEPKPFPWRLMILAATTVWSLT